jgi:uncharacterized membrane protein
VVLPSDFGLPPTQYVMGLVGASVVVGVLLYRNRPPVTEETVTAMAPWMAAGGTLYALYQVGGVPTGAAPLFGSPAVYVTVGILAGGVWLGTVDRPGDRWGPDTAPGVLATVGTTLLAVALLVAHGETDAPALGTSGLILVASVLAAAVVWGGLRRFGDVAATGTVGVLTVFGHALDGVSTAVGYDALGFGEQTPLSRIVLQAGEALPTADLVGAGWLFVLVKLALAALVVVLFETYVREEPAEGYLLLGLVAAVGLGPGAHNAVLFAIS